MNSENENDDVKIKKSKKSKHSKSNKNKTSNIEYDPMQDFLKEEKQIETLWEIALNQNKLLTKTTDQIDGKSIIFLGDKSSGKTTILLRILDRDEIAKPTIALEYNFGKKSKGTNLEKEAGHFWELGGGMWLHQLLDVIIDVQFLRSGSSVALFLDLSQPNQLWPTLKHWLDALTARIHLLMQEISSTEADHIKSTAWTRVGEEHCDREILQPLLVPILIVGTKYDIFQSFDQDKLKLICMTLRFVAHRYGAHLQFCSTLKHESLLKKTKILVNHLVFDTQLSGLSSQTDHNKPISIIAGQDTFADIGTPSLQDIDLPRSGLRNPMDLWAHACMSVFPPDDSMKSKKYDDPLKDSQYKEEIVDEMRRLKDQELLDYQQKSEKKRKEMYSRRALDAVA